MEAASPTPPQSPQNVPSTLQLIIDTAADNRRLGSVLESATNAKDNILRDYATTGVAVLGLALTVITVKPSLIKTSSLLVIGLALTLLSVLLSYITRTGLTDYLEKTIQGLETQYTAIVSAARILFNDPNDKDADARLNVASKTGFTIPPIPSMTAAGYRGVGFILLCGAIAVACSLVFKISLG